MRKILLAALAILLVAGCSQAVRYSPGELEVFSPEIREHIKKKEVSLGMSQAAVRYSWGAPKAVKVLPDEDKEIWVYSSLRVYVTKLTFLGGKLTGSSSRISFNNPLTLADKEKGSASEDGKADSEAKGGARGDSVELGK
jgi:hypothetical protein